MLSLEEKLRAQASEMSRRCNIPIEEALAMLMRGRGLKSKSPGNDGDLFEQKVREAIAAGSEPQQAFQQIVRAWPAEAREYFLRSEGVKAQR